MKKKGFTLIELLAVIVILAIIALIATPLVLKYIKKAEEGANDTSVESILRAGDNYYTSSLLKSNVNYPISFDLSSEDDIKELGVKGSMPEEGRLEIYKNGTTFLEAIWDDIIYSKLPNETKVRKNAKVVGDSNLWITDGNGAITSYNVDHVTSGLETRNQQSIADSKKFNDYIQLSLLYATGDRTTTTKIDFSKTLTENIELLEDTGTISRSTLPLELNQEIDVLLNIFNTNKQISMAEVEEITNTNINEIIYAMDFYVKTQNDLDDETIMDTNAYKLIFENYAPESSNLVVVPNYVKHEDGTLEKITKISGQLGVSELKMGKDLIISYGIEEIGELAFYMQGLNSVVIPYTVKTIGSYSFGVNAISSVKLPESLEVINTRAFRHNQLSGEIIIPKNVTSIGSEAFSAETFTFTDENCETFYGVGYNICDIRYNGNAIEKLTFEDGSKIQTIDTFAFYGNLFTSVTIPGSIKKIDRAAFYASNLTSAVIQRAPGSDLIIDKEAFGTIGSGEFQPRYEY